MVLEQWNSVMLTGSGLLAFSIKYSSCISLGMNRNYMVE